MQIEIPDISPADFGKAVLQMIGQSNVPAAAAMQVMALQHMAVDLVNGSTTIVAATEPPGPAD